MIDRPRRRATSGCSRSRTPARLRHQLSRADAGHVQLQLAAGHVPRRATAWAPRSSSIRTGLSIPDRTLHEGGVRTWGELRKKKTQRHLQGGQQIVEQFGHDLDTPWQELSQECQQAILYGGVKRALAVGERARLAGRASGTYEGTVNGARRRYRQTKSEGMRRWYAQFMSQQPCPTCHGQRLRPESAAVTVGGQTIDRRDGDEHRRGDRVGARACGRSFRASSSRSAKRCSRRSRGGCSS